MKLTLTRDVNEALQFADFELAKLYIDEFAMRALKQSRDHKLDIAIVVNGDQNKFYISVKGYGLICEPFPFPLSELMQ